jgi:hypothetical protein
MGMNGSCRPGVGILRRAGGTCDKSSLEGSETRKKNVVIREFEGHDGVNDADRCRPGTDSSTIGTAIRQEAPKCWSKMHKKISGID